MNKIIIKGLECFGKHGVLKEENTLGQKFVISAEMTTASPHNDDISSAVDYAEVCRYITKYVSSNVFKLIETLAENLADNILTLFNAEEIKIKVEKPFAPVGLPLETVAAQVQKRWNTAYLGLGSNIGDKKNYIDTAITQIEENKNIKITKISEYMVTKPYGYTEQDDFLNAVIEIKTILNPFELLSFTSSVEKNADRKREIHWGPRTLDIDILLYENFVCSSDVLTIPHIDMHNREFVLKPLCDIAPYAVHNAFNKSIYELYKNLKV